MTSGVREAWDNRLMALAAPAPLLQSWGYGETQSREGWSVERLALPGGARATVLLQGRGALRRAYVPRGPVPAAPAAVRALLEWARDRRLAGLRVEPEGGPALAEELRSLGFRPADPMHPAHTVVVPLGGEEEMLANLKPKHRYNVRLALRRGVSVEEGEDAQELSRQSDATARRQGISLPQVRIYRHRLELLDWCRTYVARHEGEAIAAIMVARFDRRAYYLFGGATGRRRELMPAYLLQWSAMRAAAAAGCGDYDLWGVPPRPDPEHPWHGLWQFKTGFGGKLVELCGAWEIALRPGRLGLAHAVGGVRRAGGGIFTALSVNNPAARQ